MAFETQPATTGSARLRPLAAVTRQRGMWSFAQLAGVLWRGLTGLPTHLRVLKLLKQPILAETASANPRLRFKYLTHDYLARGLSTGARAASFLHHYQRLSAALTQPTLRQVMLNGLTLHRINAGDGRCAISMNISRDFDKEGELSLNLHVDGEIVFLIAFTLVPGAVVGADSAEALLVSRMQGMKGSYELIKAGTQELEDIAPAAVLFAALQGLAQALGVKVIAGVSAARQGSFGKDAAALFEKTYDTFFAELGAVRSAQGMALIALPMAERPLSTIKKGHKIRTRKKRALKQAILAGCAAALVARMTNPAGC